MAGSQSARMLGIATGPGTGGMAESTAPQQLPSVARPRSMRRSLRCSAPSHRRSHPTAGRRGSLSRRIQKPTFPPAKSQAADWSFQQTGIFRNTSFGSPSLWIFPRTRLTMQWRSSPRRPRRLAGLAGGAVPGRMPTAPCRWIDLAAMPRISKAGSPLLHSLALGRTGPGAGGKMGQRRKWQGATVGVGWMVRRQLEWSAARMDQAAERPMEQSPTGDRQDSNQGLAGTIPEFR